MVARLAIAERVGDVRSDRRGIGRLPLWPLAVLGVVGFLVVLAVAETVWIPNSMPREYVSQTNLVVIPRSDGLTADSTEWTAEAVDFASSDAVLASIVDMLNLRTESSAESLAPGQLRRSLNVSTRCIQIPDSQEDVIRGILMSITVRGGDNARLSAIAKTWAQVLTESNLLEQRDHTFELGTPYLPCLEE